MQRVSYISSHIFHSFSWGLFMCTQDFWIWNQGSQQNRVCRQAVALLVATFLCNSWLLSTVAWSQINCLKTMWLHIHVQLPRSHAWDAEIQRKGWARCWWLEAKFLKIFCLYIHVRIVSVEPLAFFFFFVIKNTS